MLFLSKFTKKRAEVLLPKTEVLPPRAEVVPPFWEVEPPFWEGFIPLRIVFSQTESYNNKSFFFVLTFV